VKATPDGGLTDTSVEWGVRTEHAGRVQVENYTRDRWPRTAEERAKEFAETANLADWPAKFTAVRRTVTVTYGPWMPAETGQRGGEEMAEQPAGAHRIHYGARPGEEPGEDGVTDYGANLQAAAEAATMPGCELVQSEVTYSDWTVIPNPLLESGETGPSGS